MKAQLIEKIKTSGYWRINFRPTVYNPELLRLEDCRSIIERNSFDFRGWPYPYYSKITDNTHLIEPAQDHYMGSVEWDRFKEVWHMYRSGQFLQYLGLREDWYEGSVFWSEGDQKRIKEEGPVLGFVLTTFQISEIFEFLSRLCIEGIYDKGVEVSIGLKNTTGRKLWVDNARVPFSATYRTNVPEINLEYKFNKDDILVRYKEVAIEVIESIFDVFGWHTPNRITIKQDQENLYSRKV